MTTKVFVGNLAFRTTDQDLQAHFEGHGEIKSAVVITRGRRSLGYGFVDFANQNEAEEAVKALDQSSLGDRALKVEIAKDLSEREPREPREPKEPREPRQPRPPRQPRQSQNQGDQNQDTQGDFNQTGEPGPAPRRKRLRNKNKNKRAATGDNQNTTSPDNAEGGEGGDSATKQPKARRERVRREKPQREKVLSKTTLFVANLPFSLDDEALSKIFEGSGCVSARVVKTRNLRSRGYGFVEFASEQDQLKALEEKQGYEVTVPATGQGSQPTARALSLSISSSPVPEPQSEGTETTQQQ